MVYVNKYWATWREGELFIRLSLEGPDKEAEVGEIYTSPKNGKTLLRILEKIVKEYEDKYGELPEPMMIKEKEEKKDYRPGYVA